MRRRGTEGREVSTHSMGAYSLTEKTFGSNDFPILFQSWRTVGYISYIIRQYHNIGSRKSVVYKLLGLPFHSPEALPHYQHSTIQKHIVVKLLQRCSNVCRV